MKMSPSLRCDAPHPKLNFRERRACEVRRITLLGTPGNRVEALIRWRSLRVMLPTAGVSSRLVR